MAAATGLRPADVGTEAAGPMPSRDLLIAMHRTMVRIRLFEERVLTDYLARKMPGFTHSYIGEEAVATGRLCGARARRPHHLHPSRPRPCDRQGRRRSAR